MFDVKGKSINDIMNIDPLDLMKMSSKELRTVTNRLVSASNKRIRRLEKTEMGRTSPAYINYAQKRGKPFSTRGKNVNQLRNEFAQAQSFLSKKTSTLSGWKDVREDVESRLGGSMTNTQSKKFWKAYRELEERTGGFLDKNYGGKTNRTSDRIQKMLYETFSEKGWRTKRSDIIETMKERYDELYEEEQKELSSLDENDDDIDLPF